jgi:hypothetical protein
VNAVSFFVSALLILRIRHPGVVAAAGRAPSVREGFAALWPRPALATGVVVLGVAVTISAGTWIGGVPTLVRDHLHRGAGEFSLVMVGYAGRRDRRRRVPGTPPAAAEGAREPGCVDALPSGLRSARLGASLWPAVVGAFAAACGQSSAQVLLVSAAQEEVPDTLLGRVIGLISLVHRGAHATGLMLVAPLFAVLAPQSVFAAAAIAIPLVGLAGAAAALAATRRVEVAV